LSQLVSDSLVIGQEICICTLLFCFHRILMNGEGNRNYYLYKCSTREEHYLGIFTSFTILLIIFYSEESSSSKRIYTFARKKRLKFKSRLLDSLLLAGILRLLSALIRTLTASYSSDTVTNLALTGVIVHIVTCDYVYANGHCCLDKYPVNVLKKKSFFLGGTISLNASLFSTTLLSSRLESNLNAFLFVLNSLVAFAFYPASRHVISSKTTYRGESEFVFNLRS